MYLERKPSRLMLIMIRLSYKYPQFSFSYDYSYRRIITTWSVLTNKIILYP